MLYANDESNILIDADGDGYGDPTNTIEACEQPSNATDNDDDCDDNDANVNPDSVWYADADGDGFGGAYSVAACLQPF